MHRLEGALRSYAWGSRTAIAELRGLPVPTAHPEAELWLGAHPADPARVVTDEGERSLLDLVRTEPERQLGRRSVETFGERLPFLLKLLAAEEPLSLQAHPSAEQAREGFARENELGIPLGSSIRNYKDDSHKPELVVALSRFDALAGFRDPKRTVELLDAIAVPELQPYAGLIAGQPDSDGLRALFTTWITLPQPVLSALMPRVLDGCVEYLSGAKDGDFVAEVRTALELSEVYPGDAGVLAALLLNRVTLEPGQALYLDAGNLHAYLHGMAVEIMANSDNVLRGGLTPKHVDVPELLRVLDFDSVDIPVLEAEELPGSAEAMYVSPAPEFCLTRIDLSSNGAVEHRFRTEGPQILLCTAGSVQVACGSERLDVEQGSAVWIAAEDPDVSVTATSDRVQLFNARVGAPIA
ncbi:MULTISPECIES: mannose-6-phosphate isomerase, class I [unclassified Rhodococcus (in: high G+C Gram-positive bacteria)]|uniref:mannose-6-phosphate isomerase, class I n=1 Tax=unclassified Rhodococcus (in: high G+C Gram-positive bacteria) TaxID=192944 RepID=UPI00131FBA14|nr:MULTISPECIES: mannose-6-phosphate isomerase, class I [unclassified Rhodococcus (in: high G+C Gram-positive bacteria)]QHE71904.1 Mannose-6-phosphate isomerase [Rhodococcus sp. WAY2]